MLYEKLNYLSHIAINSKYKLFINLFIFGIIYSIFYGNTVLLCMNGNPEVTSFDDNILFIKERQIQRLEAENRLLLASRLELNREYVSFRRISEAQLNKANHEISELRKEIDVLDSIATDLFSQNEDLKDQLAVNNTAVSNPIEVNINKDRSVLHPILRGSYCFIIGATLGLILLDSIPIIVEGLSQISTVW